MSYHQEGELIEGMFATADSGDGRLRIAVRGHIEDIPDAYGGKDLVPCMCVILTRAGVISLISDCAQWLREHSEGIE